MADQKKATAKPRYTGSASNIIPPMMEVFFVSNEWAFFYFIYGFTRWESICSLREFFGMKSLYKIFSWKIRTFVSESS